MVMLPPELFWMLMDNWSPELERGPELIKLQGEVVGEGINVKVAVAVLVATLVEVEVAI